MSSELAKHTPREPSKRARALLWMFRTVVKPRLQKSIDLVKARQLIARMDKWLGGGKTDYQRTPVKSFGLEADWVTVRPVGSERSKRVILYLHGGGFMFSMPAVHSRLAARLCRELDADALIPHYRCAPEHPLPAAHEDCYAAYAWLIAEGFDPAQIIVAGDSAGGLLTLSTLQRIRDNGLPVPMCGVMFSPGTCVEALRSMESHTVEGDPMIGHGIVDLLWRIVLEPLANADGSMLGKVSPCAAGLHALPPLLFQAGSTEALLHQSVKAHALALDAGTIAELQVWPHMPHVWQALHWLPEAKQALDCVTDFVRRHDRQIVLADAVAAADRPDIAKVSPGETAPHLAKTAPLATATVPDTNVAVIHKSIDQNAKVEMPNAQ